jgi:hypothetical protein
MEQLVKTEIDSRKEILSWVDRKIREPNDRGKQLCEARNERNRQARKWQALQMAAYSPPSPPAIGSGLFLLERLKQAGALLRMFHFSLQFGRLRIEITRASGSRQPQ